MRALIDQAASVTPSRRLALCLVVRSGSGELHAASFGPARAAWAACADVSALTHVRYLDAPVRRVVWVVPVKYDDMWTGAKGFYKVGPVVADGDVSSCTPRTSPGSRRCTRRSSRSDTTAATTSSSSGTGFSHHHWGVLAHSTHLRGAGTYDPGPGRGEGA